MILLPSPVRIFLCTRSTDLRKSFDGLSGLVQECFSQDLLTGHLFLFLNRRRDRIKILYFDRDGLAIWYKDSRPAPSNFPSRSPRTASNSSRHNWPCSSRGSTCGRHASASDSAAPPECGKMAEISGSGFA